MYELKKTFLIMDGIDLNPPKLFLSDSISHNTYIMEDETREAFLEILHNCENADNNYEVFKEYGFFERK